MNKLDNQELLEISGGGTNIFTASFINAIARCLDAFLEIGRSIGTTINRIKSGNICS